MITDPMRTEYFSRILEGRVSTPPWDSWQDAHMRLIVKLRTRITTHFQKPPPERDKWGQLEKLQRWGKVHLLRKVVSKCR